MRAPAILLATVIGIAFVAPASIAQPMLHYTWGPADGLIVNQDFTGPATYAQTVSVTGLYGMVSRIKVLVTYGPYSGPGSAWHAIQPPINTQHFYPPVPDCEGGPGFEVSTAVAGATTIPNATPGLPYDTYIGCVQSPTGGPRTCFLQITVNVDPPFAPDPATRYGVATLFYHHQNSVAGQAPDACDFADTPRCFRLGDPNTNTTYAVVNGFRIPLYSDGGLLSWQASSMMADCWYAATPARSSTWGSIKTLYR